MGASGRSRGALGADPRITNSDGGSFDAATGRKVLANSRGFVGSYRSSYAGVSAAPLAVDENGHMQRDGWWSSARRMADLESPESVGAEAARRTIRRLGATPRSHPAGSHRLCAGGGALADRVGVRCGVRRRDLAACFVPGRQAGRADRRVDADHHRRQHDAACRRAWAALAHRPSTAKACPRCALLWSKTACCATTC